MVCRRGPWINRINPTCRVRNGGVAGLNQGDRHAERGAGLGEAAIKRAKRGAMLCADGEVQRVARPQSKCVLICKPGGSPKLRSRYG